MVHSESMSLKYLAKMTHLVIIRLEHPPLIVTPQKVTNFELEMRRPLMHILSLKFAKIFLFLTRKNSKSQSNAIVKAIFFERVTSLFLSLIFPPFCVTLCHLFYQPPTTH